MEIPLTTQIPIALLLLWLITTYTARALPTLTNKRILLLTAHPDDESMFFGPSLTYLTRPDLGNTVMILCLSSGDADGLGSVRKGELVDAAVMLGVREKEHVVVLDDARLRDGMEQVWDGKYIASVLSKFFVPQLPASSTKSSRKTDGKAPPKTNIDALITFDPHGVSSHPNHTALLTGARHFLSTLMAPYAGYECPIKLYTLTTTNILRKYASILDAPLTVLSVLFSRKESGAFPSPLLMVSGVGDFRRAQRTMTQGHRSQMRWFRWGWIWGSRYMVINDLRKVKAI